MDTVLVKIVEFWLRGYVGEIPYDKQLGEHASTAQVDTLAMYSGILGVGFVLLLMLVYIILNKMRFWRLAERNLVWAFVIVWTLGFVVYDVGTYTSEPISIIRNMPMAVLHAFGMFLLESDVSAIHVPFHDSAWFMGFFSLAHFLAAIVSMLFVIKHFGYNIVAGIKRFFYSLFGRKKSALYLFWGMNDASYMLAKSIIDHHDESRDYRIVVVRTPHDDDDTGVRNGMERLFNFLALKTHDLQRLEDLGDKTQNLYTTSTYASLDHPDDAEGKRAGENRILQKWLRFSSIVRFVKRTKDEIHVFCLSDEENRNLRATAALQTDSTLRAAVGKGVKVTLYCHARKDNVGSVIEENSLADTISVRIIDSARLSVDSLRLSDNIQTFPVSFVDVRPDGTVATAFNSLIVGFGETGREALRFLYEHSAFVSSEALPDGDVCRSPFHCHIVDRQADQVVPQFLENHLRGCASRYLTEHSVDIHSAEFQRLLDDELQRLNYIVIALHDDESGITLATRILRQALRDREDLNRFRIFVRSYDPDRQSYMQRIANYANRQIHAELLRCKDESQQTPEDGPYPYITLFGTAAEIYSHHIIIRDEIHRKAARFYCRYEGISVETDDEVLEAWKARREKVFAKDKELTGSDIPSATAIQAVQRMEAQDVENVIHMETKHYLAQHIFPDGEIEAITALIRRGEMSRPKGTVIYQDKEDRPLPELTKRLTVLAQTEHLRWNASHEMLGYVYGGRKDEVKMTHNCLVSWKRLSDDCVRSYDYDVVDTTVRCLPVGTDDGKSLENLPRHILK